MMRSGTRILTAKTPRRQGDGQRMASGGPSRACADHPGLPPLPWRLGVLAVKTLCCLLLAQSFGAAAESGGEADVLTASGAVLHGAPRIANGTLSIGGASVPVEQIVALRFAGRAPAGMLDQGLVLQDGEVLGGVVRSVQADQLVFAADQLGAVTLPLARAQLLVLAAQPLTALGTLPGAGAEAGIFQGAVLGNGDQVAGTLAFVNDQAVGINNGRRIVEIARARAAQVRLARVAAPAAAAGALQRLRLVGGDLLAGKVTILDGERCELATSWGGTVKIPAALIAALWSEGGPLTALGTLAPQAAEQTGEFDEAFPYRVDRAVDGGQLRIGAARAERGLGCHARSVLTWQLDGGRSALVAELGVDGAVGARGAAVFRIVVDGKPLRELQARGGQAAQVVAVPLAGAKSLQLIVDFPAGAAAGSHGDWCWPVLVTGVAPAAAPPAPSQP
jgi:hypothetical protein